MNDWLKKPWLPWVVYSIGAFLLYGCSLFFELTYLDDNVWLKDYRWYLKDIGRVFQVFRENDVLFGQLFYRPMIYVSFILDTQWAGNGLFSYHWTNIWLHILNTILVFYILLRFQFDRSLAFVAGLFFLAHPVFVSAVAWIPGRTDSLLAVFIFSALLVFLHNIEHSRKRWMALYFLLWTAALFTKETAVILPALLIVYLIVFHHKSEKFYAKIGMFAGTSLFLFVGYWMLRGSGIHQKYNDTLGLMLASLWENMPALIPYLGKSLLPLNVSVLPILEDLSFWYGWIACVLLIVGISIVKQKRIALLVLGGLWFVLFLIPSFVHSFLKHEYRLYVPMLGLLWIVCELLRYHNKRIWILGSCVVVFSVITVWHGFHYQDRFTFWENAVATSPHSPLAHRNLGAMYYLDQRFEEAEHAFLKALELNPEEKMCYNNLGLIYERRKDYVKAEDAYLKEIEINPYYDVVHYNLGLFYYKLKAVDNAVQLWEHTIKINPRYVAAYQQLFRHYTSVRNAERAQYYQKQLLQLR